MHSQNGFNTQTDITHTAISYTFYVISGEYGVLSFQLHGYIQILNAFLLYFLVALLRIHEVVSVLEVFGINT